MFIIFAKTDAKGTWYYLDMSVFKCIVNEK